MRTVTLGLLIVAGGTLAALPFRRLPNPRDQLDAAVRATGPTSTPLDVAPLDVRFDRPLAAMSVAAESVPWQQRELASTRFEPQRHDMPATYEPLKIPLTPPPMIRERFSASVGYQADHDGDTHLGDLTSDRAGRPLSGAETSSLAVAPPRFSDVEVEHEGHAGHERHLAHRAPTPEPVVGPVEEADASAARDIARPWPQKLGPQRTWAEDPALEGGDAPVAPVSARQAAGADQPGSLAGTTAAYGQPGMSEDPTLPEATPRVRHWIRQPN